MSDLKTFREQMYKNLRERNEVKELMIENVLKAVQKLSSGEDILISYEQLQTLEIGEVVKLSEGVEFHKVSESETEMLFHTIMIDGGKFNLHYHDCVEICKVLEGTMFETQRGAKPFLRVLNKGERAIYDKNEIHSLYATEYTLLEVRFLKHL